MSLSAYLLIGALLSLAPLIRANSIVLLLTLVYWLVGFLWALCLPNLLITQPLIWSSMLNIHISWHVDGLARLFVILISGIGILIMLYAFIYSQHSQTKRQRLLALLQLFAVSMLGIVISDDIILLFTCWEMTTITSYLLIQFDRRDISANQAAFNAMFISVLGGLAMLVGLLVLSMRCGSSDITKILQLAPQVTNDAYWWWPMGLIIAGAVTKSAQFPCHFWLVGAMKAPTPVSGYLHSATMVNAGIYLLARFHSLFAMLPQWYPILASFGIATMLVAAYLSLQQQDLKSMLAYTTLFVLGSMFYLLGGTHLAAAEALMILLLFHGIYKAALFMLVGWIDQEYGTRDIDKLSGIMRRRPALLILLLITLSAMAGMPPLFGFVVKEMLFEAKLSAQSIALLPMILSIISSIMIAMVSCRCFLQLIGRTANQLPQRKLPWGWLCPSVLAALVILLSLWPSLLMPVVEKAAQSMTPMQHQSVLAINTSYSTMLSLITVGLGLALAIVRLIRPALIPLPAIKLSTQQAFENLLRGILQVGMMITHITQEGGLSRHLYIIFITLALLMLTALTSLFHQAFTVDTTLMRTLIGSFIILSTLTLLLSQGVIRNLISLSVLGIFMSVFFIIQGAPDVAMAQIMIEILTVILIVIALRKSIIQPPARATNTSKVARIIIATMIGGTISLLLAFIVKQPFDPVLSDYFIAHSVPSAHGRNVVNVILVDFRSLDTLGEALVILATGLGIRLIMRHYRRVQ